MAMTVAPPEDCTRQALALTLLAGGVLTLSHSCLLASEDIRPAAAADRDCLSVDCSAEVGDGPMIEEEDLVPESPTVRSG